MGIWDLLNESQHQIRKENQLSIQEGHTPVQEYEILGNKVLFKREDENPTGSHKDRGLAYQISAYLEEGEKHFVISSSGNSSISAIRLLQGREETLSVFLSPNLSEEKRERISKILGKEIDRNRESEQQGNITIVFTNRAVSDAFKYAKENSYTLLRGSTDQYGTAGYTTIAFELYKSHPHITDIFIPASSGTTSVGIFDGYEILRKDDKNLHLPHFHICQTMKINTLVRDLYPDRIRADSSLADSIVDRVGHRRDQVLSLIERSKGSGWIIGDEDLIRAREILENLDIYCSYEGALTLASYLKAQDNNPRNVPLLLISGVK